MKVGPVLQFTPAPEFEIDNESFLDVEILCRLTQEPPGPPVSPLRLGWTFARVKGLAWREDNSRWEERALDKKGRITVTHPTPREVLQRAIFFVGTMTVLPAPFTKPEALVPFAKAIVESAKLVSIAGRPGENTVESFVERWVTDRLGDGVVHARPVPRHSSLTSNLLQRLYRHENANDSRASHEVSADLVAAMSMVFPKCRQCHCIRGASGKQRRGWKAVALRSPPPHGFDMRDFKDGLGRF